MVSSSVSWNCTMQNTCKEYSNCVLSALHASIYVFGFTHSNKESWCVLQDVSMQTEMKNKDVSLQASTKKHSIGLQACFELSIVKPQASVSQYLPASLFIKLVFIVHVFIVLVFTLGQATSTHTRNGPSNAWCYRITSWLLISYIPNTFPEL